MRLSNAHKALLITILLAMSVVLMAFSFHIKKKHKLMAETFYEFIEEEDEFFEEQEELAEILESFDDLTTNKAFNESRNPEDFKDEEFNETMERLQGRNANNETYEAKSFEPVDDTNGSESFDEINKIIEKRSNNNANPKSTMSYSLVGRDLLNNPTPIYLCEYGGKVVISIKVNQKGNVTEATYNNASTSNNGCLIDHALEYAKAARFSSGSQTTQIGTITFVFKGKS